MNKTELRDFVSEETGVTKREAGNIVDTVMAGIVKGLEDDKKVTLVGFGTFSVATQSARTARNPKTGEAIEVPEKMVPKFKASNTLKEKVQVK